MNEKKKISKKLVFEDKIAAILSISLEHDFKVFDNDINIEMVLYGEYKKHVDATTKEGYKYRIQVTDSLIEGIDKDTVLVDIIDFTYELIEEDVLQVNIEYMISGEVKETNDEDFLKISDRDEIEGIDNIDEVEKELVDNDNELVDKKEEIDDIDREIDDMLKEIEDSREVEVKDNIINNDFNIVSNVNIGENISNDGSNGKEEVVESNVEEVSESKDEYVTYHVHVMKDEDIMENVVKLYNGNFEEVKELNEIDNIKKGSKLIIPEYGDE